jgi:hypothetical protein
MQFMIEAQMMRKIVMTKYLGWLEPEWSRSGAGVEPEQFEVEQCEVERARRDGVSNGT